MFKKISYMIYQNSGIYDNVTFLERSKRLAERITEINRKIEDLQGLKQNYLTLLERKKNYIPNVEKIIEIYPYADTLQKNKLLKSCIEKIEYYKPKRTRKADFELTIYPRI